MANSSSVIEFKKKVINELIENDDVVAAISAVEIDYPEDLLYTHIFDYTKAAKTLSEVGTYILVEVNIPRILDKNGVWVEPRLDIFIVTHDQRMQYKIPNGSRCNRNDYLSELIDSLLNERSDFGFGQLQLRSNTATVINEIYNCRQLSFASKDLNDSRCS